MIRHGVGEHLAGAARGAAGAVILLGGDGRCAVEILPQPRVDQIAMPIIFKGKSAKSFVILDDDLRREGVFHERRQSEFGDGRA